MRRAAKIDGNQPERLRYVWCAEDEKYGLMAVYATKKAAERDFVKKWNWVSGYGGTIIKRKVYE